MALPDSYRQQQGAGDAARVDFDLDVGVFAVELSNASLEAALADVAPRAGDVAPDVDVKGVIHGGYSVAPLQHIP